MADAFGLADTLGTGLAPAAGPLPVMGGGEVAPINDLGGVVPLAAMGVDYQGPRDRTTSLAQHLAFSIPGTALAAVDTVGRSIGILSEDSTKRFANKLDPAGFGQYYNENFGGLSLAGDLATLLVPGIYGAKAVQAGSWLYKSLASAGVSTKALNTAFASAESGGSALRSLLAGDVLAATTTRQTVFAAGTSPVRDKLVAQVVKTGIADSAKKYVGSEVAMYATMNESENLYPSDMSVAAQLTFHAAGLGLSAGLETAFLKRAIRQNLRVPEVKDAVANARNALGLEAAPSRAGERDYAITVAALSAGEQAATREAAIKSGNVELAQNAAKFETSWLTDLKNEVNKLAKDSIPNIPLAADEAGARALVGAIQLDPTIAPGIKAFGDLPSTGKEFAEITTAIDVRVAGLMQQLDKNAESVMRYMDQFTRTRKSKPTTPNVAGRNAMLSKINQAAEDAYTLPPTEFKALVADLQDTASSFFYKEGAAADKETVKKLKLLDSTAAALKTIDDAMQEYEQFIGLRPYVVEPDGHMVLATDRKLRFHDTNHPPIGQLAKPANSAESLYGTRAPVFDPQTGAKFTPVVSADLIPQLPTNSTWVGATEFQQSALYAVGQHIADNWKAGTRGVNNTIKLSESSPAFSLDLAAQIIKKDPAALADFTFPVAAQGNEVEWLTARAIERKYEDIFVPLMDRYVAEQAGNSLVAPGNRITLNAIRLAANLPGKQLGTESALFRVFNAIYTQGDRSLQAAGVTFNDLTKLMREVDAPLGAAEGPVTLDLLSTQRVKPTQLVGNAFMAPRDATTGNFAKAQFVIKAPAPFNLFQQSLDSYAVSKQLEFLTTFETEAPAGIKELYNSIMRASSYEVARVGITTLAEGQQASKGMFTAQTMATRYIDVFTAADDVAARSDNFARGWVEKLFMRQSTPGVSHATVMLQLRRPENKGALFSLEQFRTVRQFGFELEAGTVRRPDGAHMFRLATVKDAEGAPQALTKKNVDAWNKFFQGEVALPSAADAYLPTLAPKTSPAYGTMPLALDELAVQGLRAVKDVMDELYTSTNFFRKLYGRSPVAYQEWYLPPPNLANKFVQYVVMPAEEGTTKAAKYVLYDTTKAGLAKQVEHPVIQDLLKQGGRLIDEDEMGRIFNLKDQAFFSLLDFSDSLAQTGRGSGALGKHRIDYGVSMLDDLVAGAESHVLSIAKRTTAALFQDQIAYARHMDSLSQVAKGSPSIWQQYVNRLMGNKATTGVRGPLDQITQSVESAWDYSYAKVKDTVQSFMPSQGAVTGKVQKDFDELKAALGGRLPYSSAAEFAENTFKVGRNPGLEKVAYGLNALTANLALRVFEIGNAVLSITGNIVSMPLVMNAMKRSNYASDEAWRAATGLLGHEIPGANVALPNAARWMTKSMSKLFTDEGRAIMRESVQHGNIRGPVAEIIDALHVPMQTEFSAHVNKLTDAVSFISDKGEQLARSWAYMGGYLLARDAYRMTNKSDMHAVARLFADNAIANFRPANKPAIFQGSIGAPLGLFQTYMWNYYGRMFRYIENKDYRALAMNYAMQAGVFGLESVPGWTQLNAMYMRAYDGNRDLVDGLDQNYGTRATDWILHGTVSNLPKVFSSDGIAVYSRGDANISRVPAFVSPANAPIVSIAENVASLIGRTLGMVGEGGTLTTQQMLEIVGTYSPNRPLARMMEVAAGVSVDRRGAVIAEDTRTVASVIPRMMGLRPMHEMELIRANARNQTTELYQQDLHQRLQTNLRAAFRSNLSSQELDNVLSDAIMTHIKAGGSPASAAEYIKNAAVAANINRNDREMVRLMGNPSRFNEVLRLLNATTDYRDD